MAQPFIADKGVLRSSPLEAAVSSRSVATGDSSKSQGNGPGANRASATPGDKSETLPKGVTEQQVAEAKAKAANGNQSAIDWLSTLGLVGGTAVAGGALYKVLSDRTGKIMDDNPKRRTAKTMGADKIATDAASPNATSAVSKKTNVRTGYFPDQTGSTVVPPSRVKQGYMPDIAVKAPTVKYKPGMFEDTAVARRAMQGIRRLP